MPEIYHHTFQPQLLTPRVPSWLCYISQSVGPTVKSWDNEKEKGAGVIAMTHLSSIRTHRSLNCLWRWCLCCFLCHFFWRPNSSSWLMLSGSRRWGGRLSSSSDWRGIEEGEDTGTGSKIWTADAAVPEDPPEEELVFFVLELQNTYKCNIWMGDHPNKSLIERTIPATVKAHEDAKGFSYSGLGIFWLNIFFPLRKHQFVKTKTFHEKVSVSTHFSTWIIFGKKFWNRLSISFQYFRKEKISGSKHLFG